MRLRIWIQLGQPFTEQYQARNLHLSFGGSSSLKDGIKEDKCALGKCVGPLDLSLLQDIDKKEGLVTHFSSPHHTLLPFSKLTDNSD